VRVLEFARSSVTFRIDLDKKPPSTLTHKPPYTMNNARVILESRLRVTERASGRVRTFFHAASCKTERVGADVDLWLQPNADFIPIFGNERFLTLKTFARAGVQTQFYPPGSGTQSDRQSGSIEEVFDRVHLDLVEREGEALPDAKTIVKATLANDPLVVVTSIESDRYVAELEFPVKTMNANERDWIYQTDTGPVLFPDLGREPEELLPGLEVAFVAVNSPDWADFIVRTPTAIADTDGVEVHHYSRAIRIDGVTNTFYRLPTDGPGAHQRVELPRAIEGGAR
jgi:hypothetical protein